MKQFLISLVIAAVLTALSYGLGMHLGWITSINWVEAFAVFTSYSCTYLCVLQTRWNYPIGALSTAAFSLLFWQTGMPALALFNLYLVFSLTYGYFRWNKDENTRPVTKTGLRSWGYYAIFGIVITALFLLANWMFSPGLTFIASVATLSPLDVGLAAFSGIAQFMLDNKKLENWVLWILVDIVSIPYYFHMGIPVTAVQMIIFLLNAGWGWYEWRKTIPSKPITVEEAMGLIFIGFSK